MKKTRIDLTGRLRVKNWVLIFLKNELFTQPEYYELKYVQG